MEVADRLIDKAKEAFIMAIEIYNKPSIRYRLEGFSFFICNAWELMLKAHLVKTKGESAIYYPDKPNRTISLENCVQRIFTNAKSPLRMNLLKIIDLRNTSTHFITEEYEMVYVPLLQACVFNFVEKMREFHSVDMTEIIPENFITLSVRIKALTETDIRGKYTAPVSEHLINIQQALQPMIAENNSSFAIRIEHQYFQTKDRNGATDTFHIAKDGEQGARIIKKLIDPNESHKYNAKSCIKEINQRLKKARIQMLYHGEASYKGEPVEMSMYHFGNFVNYYGLKGNERYCYIHRVYSQPQYTYSIQTIDFIVDEIKKDPEHILDVLKQKNSKP